MMNFASRFQGNPFAAQPVVVADLPVGGEWCSMALWRRRAQ